LGILLAGDRPLILMSERQSDPNVTTAEVIWWDATQKERPVIDNPDFPLEKSPAFDQPENERRLDESLVTAIQAAEDGLAGFMFRAVAEWTDAYTLRTLESPVHTRLLFATRIRLCIGLPAGNRFAPPETPRFPFVLTTYGDRAPPAWSGCRANLPHLAELQLDLFAECPHILRGV